MKLETFKKAAWHQTSRSPLWNSNIRVNDSLFSQVITDRMSFAGRYLWEWAAFALRHEDLKNLPTLFKQPHFHFSGVNNIPGRCTKNCQKFPYFVISTQNWLSLHHNKPATIWNYTIFLHKSWLAEILLLISCGPGPSPAEPLFPAAKGRRLYDSKIFRGLLWSIAD